MPAPTQEQRIVEIGGRIVGNFNEVGWTVFDTSHPLPMAVTNQVGDTEETLLVFDYTDDELPAYVERQTSTVVSIGVDQVASAQWNAPTIERVYPAP
jgi:hypothetical protein